MTPTVQAVAVLGVVFVQAVLLYFFYGAVERIVGERVLSSLTRDD
jgi:hypothetical protein